MTIKFHCEYCGKIVQAPDSAGGQRGKCPHCQRSNFIPAPEGGEPLDLVPLDEQSEMQRRQEIDALLAAERELLAQTTRGETTPRISQKETAELASEDLHHLVINYCLDMSDGKLERAETHVLKLNAHKGPNRQAVSDFLTGKILEPVLDIVPTKVLQGFLTDLMTKMQ
ncbi:MAG: hypothetical protein HQ546_03570 [Planctomycetes bacterium]|nr:hypothetical protein [Planctomycetota bacterium]